jgi:hypothetical protein
VQEKYNVSFEVAEEILRQRSTPNIVSESEKYFVNELESCLGRSLEYTYKTKQFGKWNFYTHSYNWFDIKDGNKIIEYNGDYYHCNPKLYEADYYNKKLGKYAKDVWKRDQLKYQTALDNGFKIKIVYESEYINDPSIIQELAKWLDAEK